MTGEVWQGNHVRKARAAIRLTLPSPCGRCGKVVHPSDRWVVGHIKSRATHPELALVPSNWRPEHRACSDGTGQAAVIAKAKAAGRAEVLAELAGSSLAQTPAQPPNLPSLSPESSEDLLRLIDALPDPAETIASLPWCDGLLPVPEEASLPLAMTPPHERAVGSYGPAAVEWAERELGIQLRWWQRLAIIRQLEHDADGVLVWRQLVESGSRRIGKSVRLRVAALWRIAHSDTFGEPQEVLLTSKDLKAGREIIRPAWQWAMGRQDLGWGVRRGNGDEEVSSPTDDRWLLRAEDAVYSYSPGYAQADESWGVDPQAISEGLEPATLERISPQLHLTSTAHVKATSLMRRRLVAALRQDDPNTLLLLWGARPGSDPGDEEVWRAASAHWSSARRDLMRSKYAAALAGEEDLEFDDPDPMRGFMAQYLNVWPMIAAREAPGTPLATPKDWQALEAQPPGHAPAGVAIESWPGAGAAVVAAWKLEDGRTLVSASRHPDLAEAAVAAKAWRCRAQVVVGASLADDPALRGLRVKPSSASLGACVSDVIRWLEEGTLCHDGSPHLTAQMTATRTKATPTGLRVVSIGAHDAIKATAWAVVAARSARTKRARILLPTAS
ncbi:hypothetical protein JCM18899A_13940 [Nocardioides sp. AN3]